MNNKSFIPLLKIQRNKEYLLKFCDKSYILYNKYRWTVTKNGSNFYLKRSNKGKTVYFHRELLKTTLLIDHINGDGLDNRLSNLRICSSQENNRNRQIKRKGSSKYKGVSYYKRYNKYEAYITVNGHKQRIGYFTNEIEAANAYNAAALKLFGKFASINEDLL